MTSRPAAPESETPETDAAQFWQVVPGPDGLPQLTQHQFVTPAFARSLERRLSLAQTEIKGHMRVVDELKVDLRRTKADLVCAEENFHVTNQAYVKADNERTQAQSRIAELEKDAARLDWLHAELKLTIAHAMHWPVTPQDTVSFRAKIDAALKDRA